MLENLRATNTATDIGLSLGLKVTAVIRGEPYTITIRGWNLNS